MLPFQLINVVSVKPVVSDKWLTGKCLSDGLVPPLTLDLSLRPRSSETRTILFWWICWWMDDLL